MIDWCCSMDGLMAGQLSCYHALMIAKTPVPDFRPLFGGRKPKKERIPLSRAAQDARRPPSPELLLGADQGRPDISAKARVAGAGTLVGVRC